MENIIDTIMTYEFGFYTLIVLNCVYLFLKTGRALLLSITSKTKTTKDDEIVAKLYDVLDKYRNTLDKASDTIEKKKKEKKTAKKNA